ncbi:coiled-coil domain-containing protein 9B isoform X2 [Electrophorus electricus]|nr:coiled-coil domain-containing protein 9B isoform X2 [Electrophorus electricus]
MLLKKEQKDAELDRKIEALRKKNEALMKRYQEVEEDKKRAEQEGMALHSRKGKVEDLIITINKSPTEKRVVTKKGSGGTSPKSPQEQGETGSAIFSAGRGKRRQLLVTTSGNTKGKRVVSERVDKSGPTSPVGTKLPIEDKEGLAETTAGGWHSLSTKGGTQAQAGRKSEQKSHTEASYGLGEYDPYPQSTDGPDTVGSADLDVATSREGQLEYLRWKKERDEIDKERVARHRNSQGQWRRAWDMDKPELMFSEKVQGTPKRGTQNRGGRKPRGGHLRSLAAESRGHPVRQHDKRGKNVPVVGSKAKGKDRLTGRARRWDAKTEEEQLQACSETSLEEFLEELDALCHPEVDSSTPDADALEAKPGVSETVATNSLVSTDAKPVFQHIPTASANSETLSSKSAEKKVRFLEDIIQLACEKSNNTDTTETKACSLKNTLQAKSAPAEGDTQQASEYHQESVKKSQEQDVISMLFTAVQTKTPGQEDAQETSVKELVQPPQGFQKEVTGNHSKGSPCYTLSSQNGSHASASTEQELLHPLKNNTSRSTEELIDSSLSVLSLKPEEPVPDHSTSTDKARENGKIV